MFPFCSGGNLKLLIFLVVAVVVVAVGSAMMVNMQKIFQNHSGIHLASSNTAYKSSNKHANYQGGYHVVGLVGSVRLFDSIQQRRRVDAPAALPTSKAPIHPKDLSAKLYNYYYHLGKG